MIIRNARVLTFDAANRVLDSGTVEILADGSIGQVGGSSVDRRGGACPTPLVSREQEKGTASRTPTTHQSDQEIIDVHGKLLMPALINCHTHLYSTLARGISLTGRTPANFPEILKKLWWRLDRALNLDDVYYSALVGLIDSAKCGVGTLVDHHSSPNACAGSLDRIEQAFREVGLRGVLCYETALPTPGRESVRTSGFLNATAGVRAKALLLEASGCTLPLRSVTARCGAALKRMRLSARDSTCMWRRIAAMWSMPGAGITNRRCGACATSAFWMTIPSPRTVYT